MKIFLAVSLVLNFVLVSLLLYSGAQGCAEIPNGRLGVLSKDAEVGFFEGQNVMFTLPKGLTVREASATGADWFEPYRFRLVVTSDDKSLVDYSRVNDLNKERNGEYYSADIQKHIEQSKGGH